MFVKELSIRTTKVRGRSLRITTTIFLCFSMAVFLMVLGMFIKNRAREIPSSDDFYFSQLTTLYPMSPWPSSRSCSLPNSSSAASLNPFQISNGRAIGLSDWIAPVEVWHSMSDKELLWRASMVPHVVENPYNRTPKVAFLFLARGRLPLAPLWEKFFKGHTGLYSIYLHTSPEFTEDQPTESSVFYQRRIPSKVRLRRKKNLNREKPSKTRIIYHVRSVCL